ncbi:MAG: hypothetical protein ACXWFF_02790 [Methylomonas sp.]
MRAGEGAIDFMAEMAFRGQVANSLAWQAATGGMDHVHDLPKVPAMT